MKIGNAQNRYFINIIIFIKLNSLTMKYLLLALLFVTATNSTFAQKTTATDSVVYGNNPAAGKYVDIRGFKMPYKIY